MNNITLSQVEEALDVSFSKQDRGRLGETPKVPRDCKDTHILLPIFPISLLDLRKKIVGMKPKDRIFFTENDAWYDNESFANEKPEAHWLLVRTVPFPGSKGKTYDDQKAMAPKGEYVPSAIEGIQAMVLHFLVNKERMMPSFEYARTSTRSSDGHLVFFGEFDSEGASVDRWKPDNAHGSLGVLFARSLETFS